jgi:hypothetical protein
MTMTTMRTLVRLRRLGRGLVRCVPVAGLCACGVGGVIAGLCGNGPAAILCGLATLLWLALVVIVDVAEPV